MKIWLACYLLFFAGTAAAAEGYVSGLGSKTCGEVTTALGKNELGEQDLLNWTQGYFSGSNVAFGLRSRTGDVTTGSTMLPDRLLSLVKSRCEAHSDYTLSKALSEVYFELRQAGH
jgi:hypothetical protein